MAGPERVRAIYNRQAARYDSVVAGGRLEAMRAALLREARGVVLELGVGTGATFAHYPRDLERLVGFDLSENMLERAREKAVALPFPVELRLEDFQRLSIPDASVDTAVSSLGLCGIPDPALLFAELRRVLKPGGGLLALEHVRPPNPFLGLLADAVNPLWDWQVGCQANRDTVHLLEASGFRVSVLERHVLGILVSLRAT